VAPNFKPEQLLECTKEGEGNDAIAPEFFKFLIQLHPSVGNFLR
jgi:hypothetical protein